MLLLKNVDHARTLLTRMQQDALTIKVQTRKQEVQADLTQKREILEHVVDRLRDLEEMSTHAEDDDASSDGDDVLGDIIATPSESMDSMSTDMPTQDTGNDNDEGDGIPEASPPTRQQAWGGDAKIVETLDEVISEKPDTVTSSNLRPRGSQSAPTDPEKQSGNTDTAQTTGAQRSLLFGARATEVSDISTKEAILDRERREQEEITEAMSRLTRELKLSSIKFGEALDEDKEVTKQAGEGIGKNELSMEAAARGMGALTRMTEGKGWWGRIILYAWVYGLMVVLVLIVFVLPKLRF